MPIHRVFLLLIGAGFVAAATAADWPQWRGPNRDGKSSETGLSADWPRGTPSPVWQTDKIGSGFGSPAVVGGRLYVIGGESPTEVAREFVVCLNVADGSEVWRSVLNDSPSGPPGLDRTFRAWGGGPRSTPTVEGEHLYALGATGDLVCMQTADGKVVWRKNLVTDLGGGVPDWAYSESPLVDGDKLVCTPGGKGGLVALNKKTGEIVWQCKELTDPAGYSSVVVAEVGGVRQYVQQTMESGVGVRAKDSKLLWKVGEMRRRTAVIPTPVVAGHHVFFTAGYGAGCELVKLEPDGNGGTDATVVYRNTVVANHIGGVVEVDGYIYGHSDTNGWVCYDFIKNPKEPVWSSQRLQGKGSITYADGHLYCYGENRGTLVKIKATPDGWEEVGRFDVPQRSKLRTGGSKFWATPVIANGKLYLREFEHLFCYDLGRPGS
jgi:outer membrane protein assembly factor BamB